VHCTHGNVTDISDVKMSFNWSCLQSKSDLRRACHGVQCRCGAVP